MTASERKTQEQQLKETCDAIDEKFPQFVDRAKKNNFCKKRTKQAMQVFTEADLQIQQNQPSR